ncbi:dihydrofolate reductase family protein [Lentzea californiensis]|uniref:dihydrofolate reductase family protein n=1 Tax=Lentzea californiensis TaxID=438851 RepID=UPI002165828A|nr:dihydrofolate reductase family protein [Lentzea californiensis]MCR3751026.1 Dihydrofolate reductase [Lentzea californiensis]
MIITMASVSLDGFMEGPGHDISWHVVDDELHEHFNTGLARMTRFIDGRRSHETMLETWPHTDDHPEWPQPMHDFGRIWRDMPKIVYSRTLDTTEWNTTVKREVVPDEIRALAGDSMVGGAQLVGSFFEHDLIDEVRLYLNPVAIGEGTPFFKKPIALALESTRAFGTGVVELIYGRP